ncbi:hypothetical protein RIF29_00175 [Crotalaria pallida]|uniref:Uncharacterized protein n=1 Tax=Crotalaria pallida TaxID=3830 RepID=A0AAN9P6E4_CROPI
MKAKGSCFASLMDNNVSEEDLNDSTATLSNSVDANLSQVGLAVSPKKTTRIRDPLAGQNSQNKPIKIIINPPKNHRPPHPSHKNLEITPNGQRSDELWKQLKEKEKVILHRMKTLEKQGIGNIDSFCTQVLLPPASNVNLAYSLQGGNTIATLPPKPPDLVGETSAGNNQNVSIEVDCDSTEPEKNSTSMASPQPSRTGLEDQTQKLDQ